LQGEGPGRRGEPGFSLPLSRNVREGKGVRITPYGQVLLGALSTLKAFDLQEKAGDAACLWSVRIVSGCASLEMLAVELAALPL